MATKDWRGSDEVSDLKDRPETAEIIDSEQVQPEVVLAKFFLTNPKWIPEGIKLKNSVKRIVKEIDRGTKSEGSFGRFRSERVDTTLPTTVYNAKVRRFTDELAKEGFVMSDVHYFEIDKGTYTQYQVVTEWTRDKDKLEISEKTMEGVDILIKILAWRECNLFKNERDPVTGKLVWTMNAKKIILPEEARGMNIKDLSFRRWIE